MEPANRWHITLNFLGDVEEGRIAQLVGPLTDVTRQAGGLSVHLKGLGAFPEGQRPRVVWVGIGDDDGLWDLQHQLQQAVRSAGLPADEPFHPHLTLARVRDEPPAGVLDMLRSHAETEFARVPVREVVLFESRGHSAGQPYHARARFPLRLAGSSGD
jgi:2'-5' RNA ligase